jgi:hypothetical protein
MRKLFKMVVEGTTLTGAPYLVLLALVWNADAACNCSISIAALALDTHLTKRSVTRALQCLTSPQSSSDPRIIVTKTQRGRGVGLPNRYVINLDLLRGIGRCTSCPGAQATSRFATKDGTTPLLHTKTIGEVGANATLVPRSGEVTLPAQNQESSPLVGGRKLSALQPFRPSTRASAHARARIDAVLFHARINDVSRTTEARGVRDRTGDAATLAPPDSNGCSEGPTPRSDHPGVPSSSSAAYPARFPWPRR